MSIVNIAKIMDTTRHMQTIMAMIAIDTISVTYMYADTALTAIGIMRAMNTVKVIHMYMHRAVTVINVVTMKVIILILNICMDRAYVTNITGITGRIMEIFLDRTQWKCWLKIFTLLHV